jgi:hypothetical protein
LIIDPLMLLVLQSVWTVLVLVSMAFRMKHNYRVHGIILIALIVIEWVPLIAIATSSILSGEGMQFLMEPLSTLIVFALHGIFGFVALISGTLLLALWWRPSSLTSFAAKSEMAWRVSLISWIVSFVVGVFLYVAVTTTLL